MAAEKRRINTQMPRRTKVRAATPMASEWDITAGAPPSALRTPANKMVPGIVKDQAPTNTSSILPKKGQNSPSS